MMLKLWGAGARDLVGLTLVVVLMTGVAAGISRTGSALAGVSARRADMMAAGVDPMPVGTAKQADRLKRARRGVP